MSHRPLIFVLVFLPAIYPSVSSASAGRNDKIPIIIDTDIGDYMDDAIALSLSLADPRIDLRGITTVHGDAYTRALLICRLLHAIGRDDVPVASGAPHRDVPDYRGPLQYGLRPSFRNRPVRDSAVEFLYKRLQKHPKQLTIITLGPLTNVAALLKKHPDCKPWIKRIVIMGGAFRIGYNGKPPAVAEWNMRTDISAAKTVLASGVPLTIVPLDVMATLKLGDKRWERIVGAKTVLTNQIRALDQLSLIKEIVLFDPAAVAACAHDDWFRFENLHVTLSGTGVTVAGKRAPNARVAIGIKADAFNSWIVDRLTKYGPRININDYRAKNASKPVSRIKMPAKIHVVEDYETDIERRWWLAGKLETKNVAPHGNRACRGVWTNDFDGRMGNPKAMYTAVIFNPVPGPPMGPKTRLGFRCFLKGAKWLKVQIYSLSKGYHRHLTLTDVPQGKWISLTVDMTKARRPDGSGGPLSADERIDDIQFYTHPDAELIIDNIVLYDAGFANDTRQFPTRPIYTGWFDTGRQGKEWPGDFEIVAKKKPYSWRAAKSVKSPGENRQIVRVNLRGERTLGKNTMLRFRYHISKGKNMTVTLRNGKTKKSIVAKIGNLIDGRWMESAVHVRKTGGEVIDEIVFSAPPQAAFLIDDVLLFEP